MLDKKNNAIKESLGNSIQKYDSIEKIMTAINYESMLAKKDNINREKDNINSIVNDFNAFKTKYTKKYELSDSFNLPSTFYFSHILHNRGIKVIDNTYQSHYLETIVKTYKNNDTYKKALLTPLSELYSELNATFDQTLLVDRFYGDIVLPICDRQDLTNKTKMFLITELIEHIQNTLTAETNNNLQN